MRMLPLRASRRRPDCCTIIDESAKKRRVPHNSGTRLAFTPNTYLEDLMSFSYFSTIFLTIWPPTEPA